MLLLYCLLAGLLVAEARDLLVLTVATEKTAGYLRFERSCGVAELECRALGMGQEWQGGDMDFPGGGWKVNLLKAAMAELRQKEDTMVMFTDSYDVVLAAGKDAILAQYDKLGAQVLFGAENFCWPDRSLAEKYPEVKDGMRFLNSGGFLAPAALLARMLEAGGELEDKEDDQLFYTKIYLDPELRKAFGMKLDSRAELFQNLNGESENIELRFGEDQPYVLNLVYNSRPVVIHGNGPSKLLLSTLGNYLADAWTQETGCLACWDKTLVDIKSIVILIYIS